MNMDDIGEVLESFRILSASLEKLRHLEGPEFLWPVSVFLTKRYDVPYNCQRSPIFLVFL
jgi:hypothetical protein